MTQQHSDTIEELAQELFQNGSGGYGHPGPLVVGQTTHRFVNVSNTGLSFSTRDSGSPSLPTSNDRISTGKPTALGLRVKNGGRAAAGP